MQKNFLKILLVILVILIILFFKACVTYRTKGNYTINSHEKYNIEKFTKIPNLKSVDILYSESEISKFYSLQNFLLEVFGKENEKIELDHTNTGEYYFYIYIKDTNKNKEYKIEKIGSIFFEKKGFDIFVPNI